LVAKIISRSFQNPVRGDIENKIPLMISEVEVEVEVEGEGQREI